MRLTAITVPACDGEPSESYFEWVCNCTKENKEEDFRDELAVKCQRCEAVFVVTEFDFSGEIVKRDDPTGLLTGLENLEQEAM